MLLNYHEINEFAQEHVARLQREAENELSARTTGSHVNTFVRPVLAEMGRQMSNLGQRLQERYGAENTNSLAKQS